jgi:hypothetical protein
MIDRAALETERAELMACEVCGVTLRWDHDHRPDNSGLDDGPEIRPARKKAAPKPSDEIKSIRDRAWATRRQKYGEHGHR